MTSNKILVVEDDAGLREALVDTLMLGGYECVECESGEEALLTLKTTKVALVVSDVQMGGMSGLSLLRSIKAKWPDLPMLLMTAYANIDDAVSAMREGAADYMAKPFAPEVLLNLVSRYMPVPELDVNDPVVGDEKSIKLLELAKKVAQSDASVMINGPSGSGKEVLSQYIHNQSRRSDKPFVAINCAAIPENMLESTLFGYEKGAFTGALQACPGKFEQAQGGTILLDEITEMDISLQAKLLRVLQEKEVERLGSRKTIKLDVRVLATSNRDLRQAVNDKEFREDLYYRLNVFPLTWPQLSQRSGDILPLAEHLLAKHYSGLGQPPAFSTDAKLMLQRHQWPGNVRELDNVIQRSLILCSEEEITTDDLILESFSMEPVQEVQSVQINEASVSEPLLGNELKQQENQIIIDTLAACNGSRKAVAEKLGISPRTLRYKLAKIRDMGIPLPA
ncbi:sigma-54 dependent transcriptional regulator [Psychrobium sp. 1_MG-2023]|uniref:sigma-54-dependent transcriptional regulator n=1 Tax=Psychrobium sp. 1_MG-2023 TaxID=3062624 RepID=UPI000C32BDAF|nr:sigma-54 dependent transcriptional regulator [Psychrobium sp. 1_MG-2023]MDP2559840.1 sigma-54 dependent transcriptional regulator [Psychrobium sp. 1_MG-2023]PKF59056.1 sigma-54-dependent Fis family transcriptional regulator [Alteromonadales bacterium alter-6D02]